MPLPRLHVSHPAETIIAFYAGREDPHPVGRPATWINEGLRLGTASYAVVDGDAALVFDTHASLSYARTIRETLASAGATRITVLLSHHHLDHVAGTEVFADCEILSGRRTDELLAEDAAAIESGTSAGPPAICPLVRATRLLDGPESLRIGRLTVELFPADIHAGDTYLAWLPETRTLLAADAVEDPITYVAEPERLAAHLPEIDRLSRLGADRILPAHGDPETIARGGYPAAIVDANRSYVQALLAMRAGTLDPGVPLARLLAGALDSGILRLHPEYESVHRENVAAVLEAEPDG